MTKEKKHVWRLTTRIKLYIAGWRPQRNRWNQSMLPDSFELFPVARTVLREFGGLRFRHRSESVILEPALCEDVVSEIKAYGKMLKVRLFPLGVMEHQDKHYLLIDEHGIVYTLIDELEPLASTIYRAIELMVRGNVNRREMEDDLRAVGLNGKVWRLGQTR